MSRAAFFDALVNDSSLNDLGINDNTVFHNYSSEERPVDDGPFIILRWGEQARPLWQEVKAPVALRLWVHWPIQKTNDFTKLIKILDQIDSVVSNIRDVPGEDDYTLSFVQIGDRSIDLVDDGFDTITKNAGYELFSVQS